MKHKIRNEPCFYILEIGGYHKIGIASNAIARIESYPPYPVTVVMRCEHMSKSDAIAIENYLIGRLKRYSIGRREWFDLPARVLQCLCRVDLAGFSSKHLPLNPKLRSISVARYSSSNNESSVYHIITKFGANVFETRCSGHNFTDRNVLYNHVPTSKRLCKSCQRIDVAHNHE